DWSYRATPFDDPDLGDLPPWLRARFAVACSNGIDDDGDGLVDYPEDPGCKSSVSTTENPACQNGIDDDGDAKFDFDSGVSASQGHVTGHIDPECNGIPWLASETPRACGLGWELGAVGVALELAWRRTRRIRR